MTSTTPKGARAKEGTPFGPVTTQFVKTESSRKAAASPKTPVAEPVGGAGVKLRLSVNNEITEMKSADKKEEEEAVARAYLDIPHE